MDNQDGKKFMFIIDSVDALRRINDPEKGFDEPEQVAGGALITSVFLKNGLASKQNGTRL